MNTENETGSAPIAYDRWLEQRGRSKVTGWRWRKLGWISPINISGRLYMTAEDNAQFTRRAAAGEFAKVLATPPGRRKAQ